MNISVRKVFTNSIYFLAFGFGSGLSPIAPGTMGTLVAIPIYCLMHSLSLIYYVPIILLLAVVGIWICDVTGKAIGIHDYPGIVWDEIVGFLWTMTAVPFHWYWIITGFILFRLFDIWKPWPIRWLDLRVQGGLGVMVDDLLAAVCAAIVLWLLIAFL